MKEINQQTSSTSDKKKVLNVLEKESEQKKFLKFLEKAYEKFFAEMEPKRPLSEAEKNVISNFHKSMKRITEIGNGSDKEIELDKFVEVLLSSAIKY